VLKTKLYFPENLRYKKNNADKNACPSLALSGHHYKCQFMGVIQSMFFNISEVTGYTRRHFWMQLLGKYLHHFMQMTSMAMDL
jgi:hypothetical protein